MMLLSVECPSCVQTWASVRRALSGRRDPLKIPLRVVFTGDLPEVARWMKVSGGGPLPPGVTVCCDPTALLARRTGIPVYGGAARIDASGAVTDPTAASGESTAPFEQALRFLLWKGGAL